MTHNKSALLAIDLQMGPLWGTFKKEEVMCSMKNLIQKAKIEEVPIIYTQHEEPAGGILTRNSPYWQFVDGVSPRSQDIVINKLATDAFNHTKLQEILGELEVTHLVVMGARTEFCVDTTCRAAISLGYDVTLVKNGHTTVDGIIPAEEIIDHHNYHLSTIGSPDCKIKVVKECDIEFLKQQ